jgi:hypothetical protein
MGRRALQYTGEDKRRACSPRPDLIEDVSKAGRRARDSVSEKSMDLSSPEDGDIPHVPGQLNAEELYAVPVKRRGRRGSPGSGDNEEEERPLLTGRCHDELDDEDEALPPGWERHEGE